MNVYHIPDDAGYDPRAKGGEQYHKHARQKNDFDTTTHQGHGVEAAPGEEDLTQEDLLDRRGAK